MGMPAVLSFTALIGSGVAEFPTELDWPPTHTMSKPE